MSLKTVISLILSLFFIGEINSQSVEVFGYVCDKVDNNPLKGASVIVRGADGKIRKFSSSDADGGFEMTLSSIEGCSMDVSLMGFAKQSIPLDSVSFPLRIFLDEGTTLLKEVTVTADRIREQGDTIIYRVGSFAQEQDRSIGDVLRRMPGISVESSGRIQYQGEDINKFYIEGSDLLGGRYGIATSGISHEDVGAVEVMENHQPMQVLAGMSFSDKAAINLKLKNKAKATWTFHGDAGGGYSCQPQGALWDVGLFAMAAMPGFQNITTVRTNNTGEDLTAQATDFFAGSRGTGLDRYVSLSLPGVPNLSRKRTLFNRSALVSTSSLWKAGGGEFKTQLDYSFNRVSSEAANITTYFLDDGNRVVTENRDGTERSHSLSGRFIYELNRKTAFISNTLRTNIDWDEIRLGVDGTLPNEQCASLPDYYVGNDFRLIRRFGGKHLVTFRSVNEWESLPQTLSVYGTEVSGRLRDSDGGTMRQHVSDHAFLTDESAAYAFSVRGITVSLEGGIKAYLRALDSELPELPAAIPGETENVINTSSLTVYATPKLEYRIRRVNLTLNAPVSFARYSFDKVLASHEDVYFSPSLSLNWKPTGRFSMGLKGSTGRMPMDLGLIQPGYVMMNYRSFLRGVDDFHNSSSKNLSAILSYRHTRRGLFANAGVMKSWSHNPYTLDQQLYGDYVVYSYTPSGSDSRILAADGSLGKTLGFMRGSVNISASFTRNESHLLSESIPVSSVGTSRSMGAKINGSPLRWLSFDYRLLWVSSRLAMNGTGASWLGSLENELLLNVMPHRKWEWHISGEHYRNELTAGRFKNVILLDTKVIYKLSRRLELSASLSNILNHRTYNYTTYNQLTSFESRRRLRGRGLLISISLRK